MEFEGIPRRPDPDLPPFLGKTSTSGDNLRFVDLCWSDVTSASAGEVVEDVHLWAQRLIGRLERKPDVVRFGMRFRLKEMKDLLFTRFLGNVQQYGEYPRCRGRSVRRFHELMAAVEARHRDRPGRELEARYTVVAHSLGTIMSADALLYAHTTPELRCGGPVGGFPNLPFPGYIRESDDFARWTALCAEEEQAVGSGRLLDPVKTAELDRIGKKLDFLDTRWIDRVDAFVTLGAPIDKYLVMWWLNYHYLTATDPWFQQRDPERKIYHWNYCDEQDPAGHNLDVARTAPGFRAAFDTCQDVVFNRYSVPGAAHNAYWKDGELFAWILAKTVDLEPASPGAPRWFDVSAYEKLLFAIYTVIPFSAILLDVGTLTLALQASSVHAAAVATVVFVFTLIMGRKLLDLSIWWRQIQRLKGKKQWGSGVESELSRERNDAQATRIKKEYGDEVRDFRAIQKTRESRARTFRFQAKAWLVVNVVLGGLVAGVHAATWPERWHWSSQEGQPEVFLPRLVLIAGVALVALVAYQRLLVRLDEQYRSSEKGWWVDRQTVLTGWLPISLIALVTWRWTPRTLTERLAGWNLELVFDIENVFFYSGILFVVSGIVLAYRWARFRFVKRQVDGDLPDIDFEPYATEMA